MTSISKLICEKFNVTMEADAPHKEKYQFLINFLGYEEVKKCIPYSLAEIKNALPKDEYLNNLPLYKWDKAAGFSPDSSCKFIGSKLTLLYREKGLTGFSCSNGVSLLKECARMWANEV